MKMQNKLALGIFMDWNVCLQNSTNKALTPNVTVFWDRDSNEVNKIKLNLKVWGSSLIGLVHLQEETPKISLSTGTEEKSQGEGGCLQVWKERSHQKATLLALWSWISSLHNCKKINFGCLIHPISGILLWQPDLTNTGIKMMGGNTEDSVGKSTKVTSQS